MQFVHNDMRDNGLSAFVAATVSAVICNGAPTTRAEAISMAVTTAVSVPSEDKVLGDATGGGRWVVVAEQEGATVTVDVTENPDLWIAYYDDTKLWVVSDEITDQPLTENNPIKIPTVPIRFGAATELVLT